LKRVRNLPLVAGARDAPSARGAAAEQQIVDDHARLEDGRIGGGHGVDDGSRELDVDRDPGG